MGNSSALAIAAAKAKDLMRSKNLTESVKNTNNGSSVTSNGNESSRDGKLYLIQLIISILLKFSCISSAEEYRANSAENSISGLGEGNSREDRKRKKKSRWATTSDGTDKTFIPGMPTILPSNLNPDQQEAYLGNYSNFIYFNLWNFILLIYFTNR